MEDLSLDGVLDLEQRFYEDGYREGQEQSAKEQFLEGKIYGLQTGFQRFLVVGYLQGLLEDWSGLDNFPQIQTHLEQLRKLLDSISPSNDDQAVAQYEKNVASARNKARVIATLTKTGEKLVGLDQLIKDVGGSLQVSENLNEMW